MTSNFTSHRTCHTWKLQFLTVLQLQKKGKEISKICDHPLVCHFAFQLSTLLQSLTVINFQPETSEHSKIPKRYNWNKQHPFSIETSSSSKGHKRLDAQKTAKPFVFFLGFYFRCGLGLPSLPCSVFTSKAFSEASDVPRPLGLAASKRGSWDRFEGSIGSKMSPFSHIKHFALFNQRPKMPKKMGFFKKWS